MTLSSGFHERRMKALLQHKKLSYAVGFLITEFHEKYKTAPDIMQINACLADLFNKETLDGWRCPIPKKNIVWVYCTQLYEELYPDRVFIILTKENNWDMQCTL